MENAQHHSPQEAKVKVNEIHGTSAKMTHQKVKR
jgi:hypothetical protein